MNESSFSFVLIKQINKICKILESQFFESGQMGDIVGEVFL